MQTEKKKQFGILVILFILLILINYSYIDNLLVSVFVDSEYGVVERVIDGDTVVINGTSVRLLGINSPEKGAEYYVDARNFLEQELLNKTVSLEFNSEKFDRYGRKLAYIFLGNRNINLEVVERGLGNYYFPVGKQKYYAGFVSAWGTCVEENVQESLCENSLDVCAKCIEVESIDLEDQKVIFENSCSFECDLSGWEVKDEGRKIYSFPQGSFISSLQRISLIVDKTEELSDVSGKIYYWPRKDYVWTYSGDTLFLRDSEGKLVLWEKIE